jgi:iodothyronine deiodinase-like protein
MRERYGKDVEFVVVYIAEAHAIDSAWPMLRGPLLEEPETLAERMANAGKCAVGLELKDFKTVVDGIDDKVMRSYQSWPDRLYLVGLDGKIAYKGGKGPFDFKPEKLDAAIAKELGLDEVEKQATTATRPSKPTT